MSMSDGLLSQDDIDALTKGLLGGAMETAPTAVDNGPEWDAARKLIRLLSEQASSVVSTVLSKSVDFRPGNLQSGKEQGSFPSELLSQGLLVGAKFSKDAIGRIEIAMEKRTVAILADLMLMGSGDALYVDDHKDAIQEILSQIMGSASTTMTSELGMNCEIKTEPAAELPTTLDVKTYPICVEIKLNVEGFPEHKAWWLISKDLLDSLAKGKLADTGTHQSIESSLSGLNLSALPTGMSSTPISAPAHTNELQHGGQSSGGAPSHGFASAYGSTGNKALDLLMDIELPLTIELGRTQMSFKRILELGPGAIVEMERFAGEPVDILINGKVVAKGEVVVVDENFGVRLVSLVTPEERIKMLR